MKTAGTLSSLNNKHETERFRLQFVELTEYLSQLAKQWPDMNESISSSRQATSTHMKLVDVNKYAVAIQETLCRAFRSLPMEV
jgi:hypothetical protein